MARIIDKNFYASIASNMNKSEKMVEKYTKGIISQLFKEMNRGNSVTIKRFATFNPVLVGGTEMMVCGEKKYVEPRITIDFSLTKAGIQIMNNMALDYDTKERIKNNRKLMPYEKEIIGEPIEKKKNLEKLFNKIVSELEEKNGAFDRKAYAQLIKDSYDSKEEDDEDDSIDDSDLDDDNIIEEEISDETEI